MLELRLKQSRLESPIFVHAERVDPLVGLVGERDENATGGIVRFGGHATVVAVGLFTGRTLARARQIGSRERST